MRKIELPLFLIFICFIFSLVACNSPPNLQFDSKNKSFDKSLIQKTNFKTKSGSYEPKILTFPSKVIYQTLAKSTVPATGTFIEFSMKVNVSIRNAVTIPKTGRFNVVFTSGNQFQVINRDAVTGDAMIQIPAGFQDGYINVIRDGTLAGSTGKLKLEDNLYYFRDDLQEQHSTQTAVPSQVDDVAGTVTGVHNTDYRNVWYKLGKRPFPVPADWHSPEGGNYVLNFTNNGVKEVIFRFYTTSTFDYPMGIKEIGTAGGTIVLPGVGKLEIPNGALNQNTTIVMRQELEAPEMLFPNPEMGNAGIRAKDYVSPIVKLEPFGLRPNKPALIYLETDRQRVGNNHPQMVDWTASKDKIKLYAKSEVLPYEHYPLNLWTHNFPTTVREFMYYYKVMDAGIKPDECWGGCYQEQNSANTQSFGIKTVPEVPESEACDIDTDFMTPNSTTDDNDTYYSKHFKIIFPKDVSRNVVIKDIIAVRLETAYDYYRQKAGSIVPVARTRNDCKILVKYGTIAGLPFPEAYRYEIDPADNSFLAIAVDDINLLKKPYGMEHELWHVFQHTRYTDPVLSKYSWVRESSATHMSGRVIKENFDGNLETTEDINFYKYGLNEGLKQLAQNFQLTYLGPPDSNGAIKENYFRVGFFTFLSNLNTSVGSDTTIGQLFAGLKGEYEEGLEDLSSLHLDKFHDYAKHSYIGDRFDIYTDSESIIPQSSIGTINLDSNTTKSNPLHIGGEEGFFLKNNAASYNKIKSNVNSVYGTNLGIKINSPACITDTNNSKVMALVYNSEDANRNAYDTAKSKEVTGTEWVLFPKFEPENHVILVTSHTDKTLNDKTCNYQIDSAISTLFPDRTTGITPKTLTGIFNYGPDHFNTIPSSDSISSATSPPQINYSVSFTFGVDAQGKTFANKAIVHFGITYLITTPDYSQNPPAGYSISHSLDTDYAEFTSTDGKIFTFNNSPNGHFNYGFSRFETANNTICNRGSNVQNTTKVTGGSFMLKNDVLTNNEGASKGTADITLNIGTLSTNSQWGGFPCSQGSEHLGAVTGFVTYKIDVPYLEI